MKAPGPLTAEPPQPLVDVLIEDARWTDCGLAGIAETAARATLAALERDPDRHELSLLACDDQRIAELNAAFRGCEVATNVLSWPAFDPPVPAPGSERLFIGDLALAYGVCHREAETARLDLAHHAAHLVVHGILHLLGYDHASDAEADAMESIEIKILASVDIANPYTEQERP